MGKPAESSSQGRQRNDKYQRILESAVKVFAENGYHESTISQIAREAGVADGTIYLYFKSKDDILVHFFQEAVESSGDTIDKLRNLIRRHLEEFQRDRNMAVLYQAETHRAHRLAEEQIREMAKMYHDMVSEIIEEGQQEGAIRKDLYVGLVKRVINGSVDEVINTWLHSGGQYDLVSMADPLVDLLIRGIGNPDGPEAAGSDS
jgi:TetR/AcrR family fatty acid metabolism transcriptional regulator